MESVLPEGEVAERFAEPVPSPALLVSPCAAVWMLIQRLPAERPSSGSSTLRSRTASGGTSRDCAPGQGGGQLAS